MPKSHGIRRKSRHIMTRGNMSKGLSHLLINYSIGDKVAVIIDPREHKQRHIEDSKEGLDISRKLGEELQRLEYLSAINKSTYKQSLITSVQ